MRISIAVARKLSLGCFAFLGLAQAQESRQPATPTPAPSAHAYLRFGAPVYRPGDCADLHLTMPLDGANSARIVIAEIAAEHDGRAGARVTAPMRVAADGSYALARCVRLGGRGLSVQPGSVLGAVARNDGGTILAVALAAVPPKTGAGRVHFTAPRVASIDALNERGASDTLTDGSGRSISFVRNRVIVLERERHELERFLARRHGRIVSTLGRHHLVEVDPNTANPASLEPLAESLGAVPGDYRFGSPGALRLGALVLEELAGGLPISLDVRVHDDVQPQTSEEIGADVFAASSWFFPNSSNVNLAEGMALASLFLVPSTPDITIAFDDHGFAGPDDFTPSFPAVVQDYGYDPTYTGFVDIPQCDVGSGKCSWMTLKPEAAGPAPSGDPTWHGAHVASVAVSRWNDSQGTGGVGFPIARPYLIKSGNDEWAIAEGIARAIPAISGPSARIISVSRGENCTQDLALFSLDVCSAVQDGLAGGVACFVLQALFPELAALPCADIALLITIGEALNSISGPVKDAEAKGLLVVSSASNDMSEDINEMRRVPCVLKNVICVGGMDLGLLRYSAKGSSISIYAPAQYGLAMQAPDEKAPPGTPSTGARVFNGTSYAVPVVSASLALALSINPLLTTDEARNLLRDSSCSSSHPLRMDGSSCTPSSDSEVDGAGYLDLLELVRRARRSAGKNPLMACTGGWDAEEGKDTTDNFASATVLPTLGPTIRATSDYKPVKPDLSIHKIRLGAKPTLDEDWYRVTFAPTTPAGSVLGFVAKFSIRVDDPSLGVLFVELWQSDPCGGDPVPVADGDVMQSVNSTSGNEVSVTARVRSDLTYYMRVMGGIQVSGLRVYGGNCYSKVHVEVMDIGRVPLLPPQAANCH